MLWMLEPLCCQGWELGGEHPGVPDCMYSELGMPLLCGREFRCVRTQCQTLALFEGWTGAANCFCGRESSAKG